METTELVKQCESEMIQTRRHIHQNPELSNEEFETTALIKEKLTEYGIEIADIGMKTGAVGILRGKNPGKTVALREDIDALPMQENTGLPYASQHDGKCHACGHDIHTTTLLYTAKILSQLRDELNGNVMFLFQPAEEKGTGCKEMIAHEVFKGLMPDVFLGLHVSPEYDAGCIAIRKGPANASCDTFAIHITGKGGHGAHPENCVDPIAISAYVLTQLQTVVSRENHPAYPAVMTVGSIHGGKANNVVPDTVVMEGTLRSLNEDSRKKMQEAIDRIVEHCPAAMRGHGEVIWNYGMPPLVNDSDVIDRVRAAAEKTIGADHIKEIPNPSLGSDDFSYMFPKFAPGVQFRLGSGNSIDPNSRHGLHSAKNVFDDNCLAAGVSVLVQFVRDYLK